MHRARDRPPARGAPGMSPPLLRRRRRRPAASTDVALMLLAVVETARPPPRPPASAQQIRSIRWRVGGGGRLTARLCLSSVWCHVGFELCSCTRRLGRSVSRSSRSLSGDLAGRARLPRELGAAARADHQSAHSTHNRLRPEPLPAGRRTTVSGVVVAGSVLCKARG